jgi:hypothetical protein
VKLTRFNGIALLIATVALVATASRAATVCPDEPERCVERGAAVSRTAGVVTSASHTVSAPAAPIVVAAAHKPAPTPARKAPAAKPAHTTPLPASATPATPGMGMLLKLSGGTGGDVSWYPARPADNTGVSWVL